MMTPQQSPSILETAFYTTFGLQIMGYLAALVFQTETFYDILGGLNFLLLAWLGYPRHDDNNNNNNNNTNNNHITSWWSGDDPHYPRLFYVTMLFVTSRGWLLVFLAWRAHTRQGDARFDGVISKPLLFLVYWMIQGCWVFVISVPLLLIQQQLQRQLKGGHQPDLLSTWDWILLLGFAMGIVLEIVSDVTKAQWIQRGRKGGFCCVGFWKYSRHPNYAGEMLQWWCAAGLCPSWIGVVSPLFTMMTLLCMNGTGLWNAEGKNLKRFYESEYAEEYAEYRRTTSPLIPMIAYGSIPTWIQQWCLFEWERFEYKPSLKSD